MQLSYERKTLRLLQNDVAFNGRGGLHMKREHRAGLIRFVAVLGAALAAMPAISLADSGPILAKAGSVELDATEVRAVVASLPPDTRRSVHSSLPALEQLLRTELVQRALLAEARAKNFEHDPGAAPQLERVEQEALIRLWIANQAPVPAGYPSEGEVSSAYDSIRAAMPLEYHIAQIFVRLPDGEDAAKAGAALRKAVDISGRIATTDFAQLAREQSEHAESAAKGGDLGFVPGNRMLPDILKAVRAMSPGQVVGPLKSSDGLRFVKLVGTRPMTLPPLAEVHDRIVADLRARRAQQLQQTYVNAVATKLGVSINEIELAKLQATLN
jgi:parvulin-like peptidyl-prolyl isomerase